MRKVPRMAGRYGLNESGSTSVLEDVTKDFEEDTMWETVAEEQG